MTSFIGRAADIDAIRAALAPGAVVTLVGPGGVGKTRLALRFAELAPPAVICDLTEATDVAGVCDAVAHVLGADRGRTMSESERIDDCARRFGDALVVLDNCEQTIDAVATCVARWRMLAEHARFLATSREPLRVSGEHVLAVDPLDESDAVSLFIDRAKLVRRDYDREGVEDKIVRRLDGMPLAIELAAARMRSMSASTLLERLARDTSALASGPRDAPARQRTLRRAIEWSWNLLGPAEQNALAQCAVFRGGFTLDAAEHVVDLSGQAGVLDVIHALVDKSLVRTMPGKDVRLGLYETIRELAFERLGTGLEAARERHARHFAARAEVWARGHVVEVRDDDDCDVERLGVELENLLAAHEWLSARGDASALPTALALDPALRAIGAQERLLSILDATLSRVDGPGPPGLRGRALLARSWCWRLRGNHTNAERDAEEALAIARTGGDPLLEARARVVMGYDEQLRGAIDKALPHYQAALTIAESIGHRGLEAYVLLAIADVHLFAGLLVESEALFRKSAAIFHAIGKPSREADAIGDLALALQELGRWEEARAAYARACALVEASGDRYAFASNCGYLASLEHELGNLDAADRGYADAIEQLGRATHRAVFIAARGALHATRDRIVDAESAFAEASAILEDAGSPLERRVIAIHKGHLELAYARGTTEHGDHFTRVRALLEDPERHSDEIRFARRLLERAFARAADIELVVASDGRSFRLGGQTVDLHAHHRLRRVLLALVQARESQPGRPVSIEDMLRTAWPGEQLLFDAARNRVYVAVSTLRRSGLRDVLLSDGDGYLLDPRVSVRTESR